jgi:NhaP-type Na+/H+ or K+/H+ antiporter
LLSAPRWSVIEMVLTSVALVLLLSLGADWLLRRIGLPGLLGMLLVGLALGPHGLNVLAPGLLAISGDLRKIALVVILLRAGLALNRETLGRLGWRVALVGSLPSLLELTTLGLLAGPLLGLERMAGLQLGTILAAVSPAVVVPAMLRLTGARSRGSDAPALMLTAAPVDNVLMILIFASLSGLHGPQGAGALAWAAAQIPLSALTGAAVGALLGRRLYRAFRRFNPRATKRALIMLGVAALLVAAEDALKGHFPFSGLTATLVMALALTSKSEPYAREVAAKLGKVWVFAEILLFVSLGAMVDPHVALKVGAAGAGLIAVGLVVRSAGVWLTLLRSPLTCAERGFCVVANWPKATVQAALGATPLALGVPGGETILAATLLSILLTAPLGAVVTEAVARRLYPQAALVDEAAEA